MTAMVSLRELFSAEIHGDLMNGRETGVIILENGLIKLNSKLDLLKKMMELFGCH